MDYVGKIITDFELHSVEGIRECFEHGVDPNLIVHGKPLIYELINMYTRGPLFKSCIQAFIDRGVAFDDRALLAVLSDNAPLLEEQLALDKRLIHSRYSLDGTFTPLYEGTLLHICAEYNHLCCAEVLVAHGADVNAAAGIDDFGFGGHTPIFHTVNQHDNKGIDALKFLVSKQADLSWTVKGLVWGKGYEWETFIPSVNPVSYAMMGLLRQFQRTETQIYEIVSILMKAKYDIDYSPANLPNKYLYG
jgi:Ankyrin repeat